MRFRRWPRPMPFEDTSRKRAAFFRKQRLEREALPLFADHIAAQQRDVEDEMRDRAERWNVSQQASRDQRAASWRQARQRLFALDHDLRHLIRDVWRGCPYPADPSYFADLLYQIEVGRIDPHRPPWIFHQPLAPRVTPNPTSFEEAFHQIGGRKVGGGPKTTAADEFLWCGNLGRGLVYLRTRVRLIDPNESFCTSSNHRLRDSHVGRAGHWIEIEVMGDCSDEDLALITRLAQASDARPVEIRRRRGA
jgi:hypothetical protein